MKKSSRQAKQAAKARLSGAISSKSPKNKKIVFGDDDDAVSFDDGMQTKNSDSEGEHNTDDKSDEEGGISEDESDKSDDNSDGEDAVEEVKGSAARESTQKLRDAERKVAKETTLKKKRKKKNDIVVKEDGAKKDSSESEDENNEEDDEDDMLTEDFFKAVDTERSDQLQKAKQDKKQKKLQQKKRLGKHTTFVVEDEYNIMTDAPHKADQNIEVIALGGGGGESNNESTSNIVDQERQLVISATLGSAPSKTAIAFARGGMSCGTSKERSSECRKRKSKNEETWKRSRKLNKLGIGSRPGRAAALFVCKK